MPAHRTRVPRTCEMCGGSFEAQPAVLRKGGGRFCSHTCHQRSRVGPLHFKWKPPVQSTCLVCNSPIFDNRMRTFCSKKCRDARPCARIKRPKMAADERFWSKVSKGDGCWEWQAGRLPTGYGRFSDKGVEYKAHRFSWALAHGAIPEGMLICHRCDNPRCVRPDHLFLGTNSDNQRDMVNKNRGRWKRAS